MAVYVLVRYRLETIVQRLVLAILLCLASFQLVEYILCLQHDQAMINLLARTGFVAISLLPPLGIHLARSLVHRKMNPWYVVAPYLCAVGWGLYFLLVEGSIVQGACGANYAILDLPPRIEMLYGIYYWGLLVIGYWETYSLSRRKMFQKYASSLRALGVGYLAFMVPTLASIVLFPETFRAIPSIMCGFALALAVILTFYVLPEKKVR